ncbi:unnamed protein product, partial [Laminaria digitata]
MFKEVVGRACKRAVSELMLEFDTGGNVRFEEGRPGDVWFSSCADLVKSRVSTASGLGAAPGVKVSRVIRIHNRFLKNRFDQCVREATAGKDGGHEGEPASPVMAADAASIAATTTAGMGSSGVLSEPSASSHSHEGRRPFCSTAAPSLDSERTDESSSLCGDGNQLDRGGLDLHAAEEACSLESAGILTGGNAWRNQAMGAAQGQGFENDSSTNEGARSNGVTNESDDSSNITTTTGGFAGTREKVRRDQPSTAREVNTGGNTKSSTEAKKKSGKRLNSSRARSLEYLFYTGRRARTTGFEFGVDRSGVDWGKSGASESRCSSGGSSGSSSSSSSSSGSSRTGQPDLLKLAEDGFHLPNWGETDAGVGGGWGGGVTAKAEQPSSINGKKTLSPPPSYSRSVGGVDGEAPAVAVAVETAENGEGGWHHPGGLPQTVVLSTHLNEADILGISGDATTTTTAANGGGNHKRNAATAVAAPPASVGMGMGSGKIVSPVCRVLVVKVYTGRTRRLQPPPRSDGGGGGFNGATPPAGVLRETWATGFKSVCISSAGKGEGGGEDGSGGGGGGGGGGGVGGVSASSSYQEWHVLDGALALPEYIIEFDISPEMGKDGQAIKDGVRQRVNKWRHELAPSSRSSSSSPLASCSTTPSPSSLRAAPPSNTPASPSSSAVTAASSGSSGGGSGDGSSSGGGSGSGGGGGGGGGRAGGGTDVLPFLIPLARLARQLEIDAASYSARYETGISKALRMQPSAPALGTPPASKSGKGCGAGFGSDGQVVARERNIPAWASAVGSGHLLTRLSLHGQGVRAIEGLEACTNLRVLILSFNEISHFNGLAGLDQLQHLDLGYNIIEGVQRCNTPPDALPNPASGCSIVRRISAAVVAKGSPRHGHDHLARPGGRLSTRSSSLAAGGVAGEAEGGWGGGGEGGAGGKPRSAATAEEFVLASLTRLDLNNNILHNLDDLK